LGYNIFAMPPLEFSSLIAFVPRALQVLHVLPTPDHVIIETAPHQDEAACPSCKVPSPHIHSLSPRRLRDLPWQGRPVTIHVAARRFRCRNPVCARRTFAERLDGVARVSARRTDRLFDLHRDLGFALGGEAGARLARRLGLPTSPDTLLRSVTAPVPGETPPRTPRVLGVDDWAWRRGHHYGTILVDLEKNQVIDLLPDREAATLAAWLRAHPGVKVVARDRAGAYADGIRQGTPDAVQVADRWHLLRNLGDAVKAVTDQHGAAATRAAHHVRAQLLATTAHVPAVSSPPPLPSPAPTPTSAQQASEASRQRRQALYEEAARLHMAGASLTRIAAELGVERKTVRRWLRLGHAPTWQQAPRDSMLTPYLDVVQRRWAEGCHNAALLWRELVALGFKGGQNIVRRWAGERRRTEPETAPSAGSAAAPDWQAPTGRKLARVLMAKSATLSEPDALFVARLLTEEPALGVAIRWPKQLNAMLCHRVRENLDDLLHAADGTLLANFAAGLRRDFDAVKAALKLPWTTRPVEGHNSRLKMLKRTMYGRAGIELLRARVLQAA
jgi:transposase